VTAFEPGDKVLIEGTVVIYDSVRDEVHVDLFSKTDQYCALVRGDLVHAVPYVDPELVPGMVVEDWSGEHDDQWWTERNEGDDGIGDGVRFRSSDGLVFYRDHLPERIRPVFDPREATT
jgi:hypothetical protein